MVKKKKLICAKCGDEVDSYSYGDYCNSCADEVWDRGFEVTTQWAEETTHNSAELQLHTDLHENPEKFKKNIRSIQFDFETQDWYCTKCETTRLTIDQQKSMKTNEVVEALLQPCPGCQVEGYLGHYFKHS